MVPPNWVKWKEEAISYPKSAEWSPDHSSNRNKTTFEKKFKKLKSRYDEISKEKTFLDEQLSGEKIKYENDILQLNAKLSLQHEQQAAQSLYRQQQTNSRRSSLTSATDENEALVTVRSTPFRSKYLGVRIFRGLITINFVVKILRKEGVGI